MVGAEWRHDAPEKSGSAQHRRVLGQVYSQLPAPWVGTSKGKSPVELRGVSV